MTWEERAGSAESKQERKPSEELKRLAEGLRETPRSLTTLVASIGPQGPLLITLLLALPFPLPGSLPGFGMAFGAAIALLGVAIATGRLLWPASGLLAHPFGGPRLAKVLMFGAGFLKRIERVARARLAWIVDGKAARASVGIAVTFLGIVLALPLPPGTNSPPAIGIILLCLGTLTRDGLVTSVGYVVTALNGAGIVSLGFIGAAGYPRLLEWLQVT